MKKIILSAAAFAFASTLGLSQTVSDAPKPAENPFKFSGMSYAYGAMYNTTTKDKSSSYGAYRFRPYFSYKTENVEATVKLEIDQAFGGSKNNSKFSADGKQQADVGNDEKTIEVKAAYLKFNVPAVSGLSVKGGADEFKTVGGFVCGTELGLGLINYKNSMIDFSIVTAKIWEPTLVETKGDSTTRKDDINFYAADATITAGDVKIRPALYVTNFGKNQISADSTYAIRGKTAYIPSLGVAAKLGDLSIDFNGSYGICSKDRNGVKYSGYAADIAPSFTSGSVKVGAFASVFSGDKASSANKNESFKSFQLKNDGYGRLFILEDSMTFANMSASSVGYTDERGNAQGMTMAGGNFAFNASPVEIKLCGAWAQLAQKRNSKKALGAEFDASVSYEVEKNAKIILEGAFLASGKAYESTTVDKQNASYVGLGMSYKW